MKFLFPRLLLTVLSLPATSLAADFTPLSTARITQIETTLPDLPSGLGPRITDRPAWQTLAALPAYQSLLPRADRILGEKVPDQPDALFLLYTQTGDRDQWQTVAFDRRNRFQTLVLAECIRNDGRYLQKIADYLQALCAENTWMYPAHDSTLSNFHKQTIDIDLGSSTLGWNIATAYWLLGDKLPPASRKLIADNLNGRIITPFKERCAGQKPLWWWMTTDMNWNSVCLAGSVGTALAIVPDKHTRAEFIAAGELYSAYFLKGFPADGYCTEGLGYWNYGFGRYTMLADTILQATAGKVDLLARPEARAPAHFGHRIQIMNTISPAFADCPVNAKPERPLSVYLNRYFHLGLADYENLNDTAAPSDLATEMIYRTHLPPLTQTESAAYEVRSFFDKAGILIARPAPPRQNSPCIVGVALKGGNNDESHNHNDIGSFVYLQNDKELILDPGPERYTARTFSKDRYDSKLLNSFGHAVPVIAGQLQRTGKEAQAKILQADFSPDQDTFSLDITSAYDVKELKSLTRTWTYSRTGKGSLTLTDKIQFSSPQSFSSALITLGTFTTPFPNQILLTDGKESALITITSSAPFSIFSEQIKENAVVTPTRIAITLTEKTPSATLTLTISPGSP